MTTTADTKWFIKVKTDRSKKPLKVVFKVF